MSEGFRDTNERELAESFAKRLGLEGQYWDRFEFPDGEIFVIIDEVPKLGFRGVGICGGMMMGPFEWHYDDPYNKRQGPPELKRFRLTVVDAVAKFVVEAKTQGLWVNGRFQLGST
jgi:hypothetical protein